MKKGFNRKTYLNIFVICLSAMTIYLLPYLRWTYYDAVMEASGLNNTQFGLTLSIFGATTMICYAPGGWLADRFSSRKLMTCSMLGAGLVGFWYATFPGFAGQVVMYILWGIFTTLTFWSAMQKATRSLGSSEEQGRIFGFVEGGRGICSTVVSFATLYLFTRLGEGLGGLRGVILVMAALCIVSGILVWIVMEDDKPSAADRPEKDQKKAGMSDILVILKTPAVWLIAMVIICCYSIYLGSTYLTPYFTNVIKISASMAAFISIARTYIIQFVAAPCGGALADKMHSITKVVIGCYLLIIVGLLAIIAAPVSALPVLMLAMIVLCVAIFAMRGIYFATVDEVNIPMNVMGTAVGLISVIGFLPDVFMSTLCGNLLDRYPGAAGYTAIFYVMLGFGVAGLLMSVLLLRITKK